MAQLDVHTKPSKRHAARFPGGGQPDGGLDKFPTRLVRPLALRAHMPEAISQSPCPTIGWNGATLVALPHLAAPLRIQNLGSAKGSLRSQASGFVAALDAVISAI